MRTRDVSKYLQQSMTLITQCLRRIVCYVMSVSFFLAVALPPERADAGIPRPRKKSEGLVKSMPIDQLTPEGRIIHFDRGREYPDHLKFAKRWQEPRLCGPNSLYVLLRLCGKQVNLEQVLERVQMSDRGASLSALSKAATHFGLEHRLMKVSQQELFSLSAPILVHENLHSVEDGEPDSGHFFVISNFLGSERFGVIDGVSGGYEYSTSDRIDRSFSGYVLAPEVFSFGVPERWLWSLMYFNLALVAALVLTLTYIRWGRFRKSQRTTSP